MGSSSWATLCPLRATARRAAVRTSFLETGPSSIHSSARRGGGAETGLSIPRAVPPPRARTASRRRSASVLGRSLRDRPARPSSSRRRGRRSPSPLGAPRLPSLRGDRPSSLLRGERRSRSPGRAGRPPSERCGRSSEPCRAALRPSFRFEPCAPDRRTSLARSPPEA